VNWINSIPPKIRSFLTTKREVPDNLWVKCPETGQMVFYKDLEANLFVVPGSNYHMRMSAEARLKNLFDNGQYERVAVPNAPVDPLKFRDGRRYTDRLRDAKAETKLDDAVIVAEGTLDGLLVVSAAQDFRFMAGSLGMAAGEAVIAGMLRAVERKAPFILFAASGGARMQEGILSLMQMPRTTIAVQRLRDAKLPYLVVLTDPTTGGVTASYAMLGDVHIAEPGALICFAGPRVIQQTIREQLPEGFQRAEYLLEHGMIDMVVHRHQLRETLSRLCHVFTVAVERVRRESEPRHQVNGSVYPNGAAESSLYAGHNQDDDEHASSVTIEAEPVSEDERFNPVRGAGKARRDSPAKPKALPKDSASG
jgi:acetyl-CoA carboxylase carboxyl transferase subunit beta